MARYAPGVVPPWLGTYGGLCIYKMYGRFFARKASSLTGKRVKKDPRFKKTMENARRLGRASGLAALLYWALPASQRVHGKMSRLTGRVWRLLKKGVTEEAIVKQEMKRIARRAAVRAAVAAGVSAASVTAGGKLAMPEAIMMRIDAMAVDRRGRLRMKEVDKVGWKRVQQLPI